MLQRNTDVIETSKAMATQLRQDFLYMQIHNLPPIHQTLEAVNRAYRFCFPPGIFCVFVVGAASKICGLGVQRVWLLAAEQHIRQELNNIDGDFEILIQGTKLYCLIGSALSCAEISEKLHTLFHSLCEQKETYTCAWTLGLGRYVSSITDIHETLFSAQHAIKYSVRDGIERFYDGNADCAIYEGGIVLMTPSEQLALKRLIQKPETDSIQAGVLTLFEKKHEHIQKYPVFAYMLALQILSLTIQTLREIMPVDRKTYELSLNAEKTLDDLLLLDELIAHTVSGTQALCRRYQMFLGNGKSQPIWMTITYIEEHYREHITLEDLSRIADRNPQYISATFSKTCGISLKAYITALRVEEAKRLLRSSSRPIGEIAMEIGYQDAKYFSRIFQKSTGQSPRDYRFSAK